MKYWLFLAFLVLCFILFNFIVRGFLRLLSRIRRNIEKIDEKIIRNKYNEEKRKIMEEQMNKVHTYSYGSKIPTIDKIVNVVRPVGPWTRYILSSKMEYLQAIKEALMEEQQKGEGEEKLGYWQIITRSRGRGKGKGGGMDL